ncbi:MAG TPA: amidohydrolase family protein [Mucilaginibacter sp.]|nr:amidohydrolase family protein [Mucilaginibacter sp.]
MIDETDPVDIRIIGEKIRGVTPAEGPGSTDNLQLTFKNALAFPGIINSHDHLDFNLFPQLGNRVYNNYTEWGNYIHTNYKEEITGVLKIPLLLRAEWGVFKNLLCGVTTVVNHGDRLNLKNDLITIFEDTHCLHSVRFEKNWKLRLNNPLKINLPAVVHVGEGDDWPSYREIDQLIRWNLLHKKLIGIHGVAMSEEQAKKFEAIIWCPQSNYFLLNKTSRLNLLKDHTEILFGTDSTLTSTWNIWEHLTLARETRLISDKALYHTLNQNAAATWGLNCGDISAGKDADIVVAKIKQDQAGFDSFFSLSPSEILLVVHRGNIRLFDEELLPQLTDIAINNFSRVYLNGTCKYIQGDLPRLMQSIRKYNLSVDFPVSLTGPDEVPGANFS